MINQIFAKTYPKAQRERINLILFTFSKLISLFGSSIFTFAIGLYVLDQTGSGLSFATTLFLGLVPTVIVNPFAGVIADRFDKKKIVILMDLLNSFLMIALYYMGAVKPLSLTLIYLGTFLTSALTAVFNIALGAAHPTMVSDQKLISLNGISKTLESLASMLGPVLGGLMFRYIDLQGFIFINGVSFSISALLEIFIDFNYNQQERTDSEKTMALNLWKDMGRGLRYILERKDLTEMIMIFLVLNFFLGFSMTVPLPYILNDVLRMNTVDNGMVQSALPLGMILGTFFIKKIIQSIPYRKLLVIISVLLSFSLILIGLPLIPTGLTNGFYLYYYLIIMTLSGILITCIDIPILYLLQSAVPEEFRGRVMSISMSMVKAIAPLGLILSGVLLNRVPAYLLPVAGGALLLLSNLRLVRKTGKATMFIE